MYEGPDRRAADRELSDIREDVRTLVKQVNSLHTKIEVVDSHIQRDLTERTTVRDNFGKSIDRLNETVYGNGHDGLVTDVKLIKEKVGGMLKLGWTAITVALASIGQGFFT